MPASGGKEGAAGSGALPKESTDFGAMPDEAFGEMARVMVDGDGKVDLVMHMFGVAR